MVSSCDYLLRNGGHESNIRRAVVRLQLGSAQGPILSARGLAVSRRHSESRNIEDGFGEHEKKEKKKAEEAKKAKELTAAAPKEAH